MENTLPRTSYKFQQTHGKYFAKIILLPTDKWKILCQKDHITSYRHMGALCQEDYNYDFLPTDTCEHLAEDILMTSYRHMEALGQDSI